MSNLDRCIKAAQNTYGKEFSCIEQYMFGFAKTYVVICLNLDNTPFYVIQFDNVNKIRVCGQFDSRVDAAKDMSFRWMDQFQGK